MVMLYHAGVPGTGGGFAGVDVFFVISGFLITGLMVREYERTGRLSLRDFWARRARRLLPAAAVVLVATAVASLVVLPQTRWALTGGDIVSAAAYLINWRLAAESVDYLAQDHAPGPVQHFWSLAVEEQFYLLWPLLVVGLVHLGRRVGAPSRHSLLAGAVVLSTGSLIWSVRSGSDPAAFFATTTRGWELGVGAILALLEPRTRRLGLRAATLLTWAGVAVLVAVTVWLPDTLPWPGAAALAPTLAAAAVIAGGPAARATGAAVLLDRPLLRGVGDLSYALYLWHWPMLVLAAQATGRELSVGAGLAVVLLSVLPAVLTRRYLEAPVRRSRRLDRAPLLALGTGAACTLAGVVAGVAVGVAVPDVAPAAPAAQRPGALALLTDPGDAVPGPMPRSISPDPLTARADLPALYGRGCESGYSGRVPRPCSFGPETARATVVLVGDSRAAQWSPAVEAVAARQGWRVVTITKAGCPYADVGIAKGAVGRKEFYASCAAWNAAVKRYLLAPDTRPDLVVTTAFSPYASYLGGRPVRGEDNTRALVGGFRRAWLALNEAGVPVLALRETPLMSQDVVECVGRHRDDVERCETPRRTAMAPPRVLQRAAQGLDATTEVDLTGPAICPSTSCPAVVGNVLVYRDHHHLTAEYARSAAPFLSQALARLRHRGFADGALDSILPTG